MKERYRKCIKCGRSQNDGVTLYRFPSPGKLNRKRCELWAKFCFPNESWSSLEFLKKIYKQHNMLCNRHFVKTCFVNQKLFRSAVPTVEIDKNTNTNDDLSEPFAPVVGQSIQPLKENINNIPDVTESNIMCGQNKLNSTNVSAKPCQNVKEKRLHVIKVRKLLKKASSLQIKNKTIKKIKIEKIMEESQSLLASKRRISDDSGIQMNLIIVPQGKETRKPQEEADVPSQNSNQQNDKYQCVPCNMSNKHIRNECYTKLISSELDLVEPCMRTYVYMEVLKLIHRNKYRHMPNDDI